MRRTSRNRGQGPLYTMAIVLGVVVFTLVVVLRTSLSSMLWQVTAPLFAHGPVANLSAQLVSKAQLSAENVSLRAQLASTTAALADRDLLYRENLQLKSLMGRDASVRSVLASVIMRPPGIPYDTLMIDAGKAQGVAVGEYVSAGGSALIGQVDTVYTTTARVTLFSAPSMVFQALLTETTAHPALPLTVEGQGGGSMVTQVPAHTDVSVGDAVVFPGIADGLSALVSYVDSKEGSSFETVYLRLPANPLQLRFVEVQTR